MVWMMSVDIEAVCMVILNRIENKAANRFLSLAFGGEVLNV